MLFQGELDDDIGSSVQALMLMLNVFYKLKLLNRKMFF